jgi:DNA-binding XRE family transcriptional regulator
MVKMDFPREMIYYRAKNNLTQAELGKQLNMARETVNRIERNKYPRMSNLMKAKIELLLKGKEK